MNIFTWIGAIAVALVVAWEIGVTADTWRCQQRLTAIVRYLADTPNGATLAQIAEALNRSALDPRVQKDLDQLIAEGTISATRPATNMPGQPPDPKNPYPWRYRLAKSRG